MTKRLTIERFTKVPSMGVLHEILSQCNIMLVAVGSMACIGSIVDLARQIHAEDRLYVQGLSAKDYALGKNIIYMRKLIQKAIEKPMARGVIVYCSCLEVLTNFYEKEVLSGLDNEYSVPVEFLYRGPLVKRKAHPNISLNAIWTKWGINPEPSKQRGEIVSSDVTVDFKEFIRDYEGQENILLITPGGCASCLNTLPGMDEKKVFYTRFDDIFFSVFSSKDIVDAIAAYFPKSEPLLILGTAVIKLSGISLLEICEELNKVGFSASFKETDGFAKYCV